jgi:serine/threonine-protein kinase
MFRVGDLCGKYRIQKLIGEGGMGEVWEAEDEYLGRAVALKVIRRGRAGVPAFSLGQKKEARMLAQIDHPNIVRVHDAGVTADGIVFIAMERIDGVSLAGLIDTLAPELSTARWGQIAEGCTQRMRWLVHQDLAVRWY